MKNTYRLERRIFLSAGTALLLALCNASGAVEHADFNGDFNDDGYDDLAIGVSGESIGTRFDAGAVNVLYGSPDRLTAAGNQIWHQDSPGIFGVAEIGDRFGTSLAAGDFNGDGNSDRAVGTPSEDFGGVPVAGVVNVLYGSPKMAGVPGTPTIFGGLTAEGNQLLDQTFGVGGFVESDRFGSSVAAGDFNGDGYADLAVGAPEESIPGTGEFGNSVGAVSVVYGSRAGLAAVGSQIWNQNNPGIHGVEEDQDRFGSTLTTGDFNGDGYADLAVGVGAEGIEQGASDRTRAGAVNVLYGSATGLTNAGNQIWHQNRPGIRGAAKIFEYFGDALAAGDFNDDGFADLAVGVPVDNIGNVDGGAVNVLYGSASGLSAAGDQLWHQNRVGIESDARDLEFSELRSPRAISTGMALTIWRSGPPGKYLTVRSTS